MHRMYRCAKVKTGLLDGSRRGRTVFALFYQLLSTIRYMMTNTAALPQRHHGTWTQCGPHVCSVTSKGDDPTGRSFSYSIVSDLFPSIQRPPCAVMHTSSSLNSRPESGFVPRKEFIRENKSAPNSFALLAIASSNCLRLYSFPDTVIASLRRLFESLNILVLFREDLAHNLCEFSLDGKPWGNPKVVATEKLLVDILAIIYQCGYAYLSTLDYGREHDDRLAIAFSKPSIPGSREGTPLPASSSPLLDGSGSSKTDISRSKRIPFAISFASSSLMRVIAPPLHLTPAILQAVRGSWPRGVVSEKKVGHDSFEFKLKGYKCEIVEICIRRSF